MSNQNGDVEESPVQVMERAQTKALAASSGQGSIAAFQDMAKFEAAQRMARALASSSLVPKEYQSNVANCLVAMELASRTDASVFMVMQNLDVIHGRPAWRAQFLIAAVNATGRFSPIRYEWTDANEGADGWGCRAVATDKATGQELRGALITLGLAKEEGWFSRAGSKWKTMPEQMCMYRAGAWWARAYCPEIALGMHTTDEMEDASEPDHSASVQQRTDDRLQQMKEELGAVKGDPEKSPPVVEAEIEEDDTADDGPDHEIAEPSEYEQAKEAYHAACVRRSLQGQGRLDWQEEHLGERSVAKWSTADLQKATKMLEDGIGLDEEEADDEAASEAAAEAAARAADGELAF